MAVRTDYATIEVPVVLRDRLAAMRIHPRQAMYEVIEDALDVWDDLVASGAPKPRPFQTASTLQPPPTPMQTSSAETTSSSL